MDLKRFCFAAIASAIAIGMLVSPASADKPVKPPKPGDEPEFEYSLVDLLGFPDNGYQSQGQFITDRGGAGSLLIAGNSRTYPDPDGPAVFHPALWHVDSAGSFPEDEPIDMGIPSYARGVRVEGLTATGIIVADTTWSALQISETEWLFPAYVDFYGLYLELPGSVNRQTGVNGINGDGLIVGTYEAYAVPGDTDSLRTYSALWYLEPTGVISDPVDLGDFYPKEINDHGVMAGWYQGYPAVAWFEDDALVLEVLNDTAQFFGANTNALNNYPPGDSRLTVVGDYKVYDGDEIVAYRGYAWRPWNTDATSQIGTLGGNSSAALGVNESGDIVGWADTKRLGQQAFLFQDGQLRNLNSMADVGKATLRHALDINQDGDIVGFMGIPRPVSEQRGFLLRPIQP